MLVLTDEFSISAADLFAATMQDANRARFFGLRTNGAGGRTGGVSVGTYSESVTSITRTLVVRKQQVASGEYPTAPLIENIGVRPDVTTTT
jgi:C-terminal processing protease CtpA/Prc